MDVCVFVCVHMTCFCRPQTESVMIMDKETSASTCSQNEGEVNVVV